MENGNKLNLYFFDPLKDEEQYSSAYRTYALQSSGVHYSPLYLLRRHAAILSGKLFEYERLTPPIYHKPFLSAILLVHIAIADLIQFTQHKDKFDYSVFYQDYFEKNEARYLGLRLLRNSLEHNNFQLFTRVYQNNKYGTKQSYNKILRLISTRGLTPPESIKIFFSLSRRNTDYFIDGPNLLREDSRNKCALVHYAVDPLRFLAKFETVVEKIHEEIKSDPLLLKRFDEAITVDNWMHVS